MWPCGNQGNGTHWGGRPTYKPDAAISPPERFEDNARHLINQTPALCPKDRSILAALGLQRPQPALKVAVARPVAVLVTRFHPNNRLRRVFRQPRLTTATTACSQMPTALFKSPPSPQNSGRVPPVKYALWKVVEEYRHGR